MTPERRRDLFNRHPNDLSDAELIELLREGSWSNHILRVAADRIEALSRATEQKE